MEVEKEVQKVEDCKRGNRENARQKQSKAQNFIAKQQDVKISQGRR